MSTPDHDCNDFAIPIDEIRYVLIYHLLICDECGKIVSTWSDGEIAKKDE